MSLITDLSSVHGHTTAAKLGDQGWGGYPCLVDGHFPWTLFPSPIWKMSKGKCLTLPSPSFFLPFLPSLLQLLLNPCCTHMHFFLSLLKEVYKLPLWVWAQLSRQQFLVYFKPQVWHRAFSDFVAVWKLSHKDQRRSYGVANVGGDQMYLVP